MNSLYLLIPIALVFTGIAIRLYFWSVDNKQFDDLDSAAHSILFDKDEYEAGAKKTKESTKS